MSLGLSTQAQQNYIEALTLQCGFSRLQRNDTISRLIGREVKFLDAISKEEASNIINFFRQYKEDHQKIHSEELKNSIEYDEFTSD